MIDIREFENFDKVKRRFLSLIDKDSSINNCWLWKGGKFPSGYGWIAWGKEKPYLAHRIAYIIFKDLIPNDKIVRHTCDNRLCVNPDHLILGTYTDNLHDCVKRGRHHNTKLNDEAVKVIKWMLKYKKKYGLVNKLANLHNVSRVAITDIQRGKTWSWINV